MFEITGKTRQNTYKLISALALSGHLKRTDKGKYVLDSLHDLDGSDGLHGLDGLHCLQHESKPPVEESLQHGLHVDRPPETLSQQCKPRKPSKPIDVICMEGHGVTMTPELVVSLDRSTIWTFCAECCYYRGPKGKEAGQAIGHCLGTPPDGDRYRHPDAWNKCAGFRPKNVEAA